MQKNFNFFRLNCLLRDTKANDFKRVIISFVCEIIFENDNRETSLNDIYKFFVSELTINIQSDYFEKLITENDYFDFSKLEKDILIKLKPEKYAKINDTITENSIDIHINLFLKENNHPISFLEPILSMLYSAIYENISSFSTDNLKNILSQNISNGYSQEQVNIFNSFLDDKNHNKNTALYTVFLKAIEFAILTSGRGVKNFSKDIFKNKTYCLDTNIIFRLLGVGGLERQSALLELIKSCVHQGIKFKYTPLTYFEFKRKIQQSVMVLSKINQNDANILAELTSENTSLFSDDFATHYSKLRKDKIIATSEQYETYMLQQFREIENKFSFELGIAKPNLPEKEVKKLAEILFSKRKKHNYTKSASQVDAHNVLYVRKLRDLNNHNYSDVKSFYLSTDRTLNKILGEIEKVLIPESILPSQLYILHNPFSEDDTNNIDYELFLKFLKKRSTEFQYKGKEVFTLIDEIRKYTASEISIKETLHIFANKRFENSSSFEINKHSNLTIKEFAETYFDKKLANAENDKERLDAIRKNADNEVNKVLNQSKNITRTIDILIIAVLIPVVGMLLGKLFDKEIFISGVIIAILELAKYALQINAKFMHSLWQKIFLFQIKNTNYFKLTNDLSFIDESLDKFNDLEASIWK